MQYFSRGVEIEYNSENCHPFEKGLNGWIADIRRWNPDSKKWEAQETIIAFPNGNSEGKYQACAKTYAAGTYTLFGYLSPQ